MSGESREKYALRKLYPDVVEVISQNIEWFSVRLIREQFITTHTSDSINTTLGLSAASKATRLLSSVQTKISVSSDGKAWFEKFVSILKEDCVYQDLVRKLQDKWGKGFKWLFTLLCQCVDIY